MIVRKYAPFQSCNISELIHSAAKRHGDMIDHVCATLQRLDMENIRELSTLDLYVPPEGDSQLSSFRVIKNIDCGDYNKQGYMRMLGMLATIYLADIDFATYGWRIRYSHHDLISNMKSCKII
jgi:hypothetical protein